MSLEDYALNLILVALVIRQIQGKKLTRVHRLPDGSLVARATSVAALLWIVGVGARLGFALCAQNGGGPAIAQFSADNHITSAAAWTACLILMSLTEVLGRTALLATRGHYARQTHRTQLASGQS